jgi:hypothetical protein
MPAAHSSTRAMYASWAACAGTLALHRHPSRWGVHPDYVQIAAPGSALCDRTCLSMWRPSTRPHPPLNPSSTSTPFYVRSLRHCYAGVRVLPDVICTWPAFAFLHAPSR